MFDWIRGMFGAGERSEDDEGASSGPPAAARSKVPSDRGGPGSNDPTGSPDPAASAHESPADAADDVVDAAAERGHELDYSPASLATLDEVVDEFTESSFDRLAPAATAYVGEVFVRNYGGEWTADEEVGWVVDFSDVTDSDGADVLGVPYATGAALEGEATFAEIHDDVVDGLAADGPTLADGDRYDGPTPGERLDEETRERYRSEAESLADSADDHQLDFSATSLAALDAFVAEYYDASPADVDRAERAVEAPPGAVPEGAESELQPGASGGDRIAAYVGEVFRREYGAEWRVGQAFDTVAVETDDGEVEFEPERLVAAAFPGYVSFQRFHDELVEEYDLASGGGGGGDGDGDGN